MVDVEKLKLVEQAIRKAIEIHAFSLKPIADRSKCFTYVSSESIDEPFMFKIEGVEFSKIHEDYVECEEHADKVDDFLDNDFDTEVDNFLDDIDVNFTAEQVDILIPALKRFFLLAQATILSDVEEKLADANIAEIESNLEHISIPGYKFDVWEETEITVYVDNEKYTMGMWDGELTNEESGLTIPEIEEKQEK